MNKPNTNLSSHPLVTVAIPLSRSKPFVDCVLNNINSLRYPNIEIIISDQHLEDDALELIEKANPKDRRCKYFASSSAINWVEHYNFLLEKASGKYFMWMPHDDTFPADYISKLVSALENSPKSILAFGQIECIDMDENLLKKPTFPDPPDISPDEWNERSSLELLINWSLGVPFRGLFRREEILKNNLYVKQTRGNLFADKYWVFATGLIGHLLFVPNCKCRKRYHSNSAHANWNENFLHRLSSLKVLYSYSSNLSNSRIFILRVLTSQTLQYVLTKTGTKRWYSKPLLNAIKLTV